MEIKYYVKGGDVSEIQKSPNLGWGGTPYYEKMDYVGPQFVFKGSNYEYKGNPYTVNYIKNKNGDYEVYEQGELNGITVDIDNKYNRDGIKIYSDTLFNGIPVNTPPGRDLQKRINNYAQGGNVDQAIGGFSQKLDPDLINKLKSAANLDSTNLDSTNINPKNLGSPEITTPTGPQGILQERIPKPIRQINQTNPKLNIKNSNINSFEQGGVTTNNSLNVMAKQQFNKVDPNLSNMTPNFQKGGEVGSNLGQLAKAAFQMANELKKQGAITEVAGEQVIAQAFQQTPEAAKMFVEAAQKQDVQTIVKLFTKLGIVK